MAKKKTKTSQPFGQAVAAARGERGLKQAELATKSRVSLRTLSLIEKKGHVPGRQIITQLADALQKDPKEWFALAGLPVEERTPSPINRFPEESDPVRYFEKLGEALRNSGDILMAPCYTSVPGALSRPDVFEQLIGLVNGGLWVAMVFPYPVVVGEQDRKTDLLLFYRDVFTQMQVMANTLRSAVEPTKSKRVNIFTPKVPGPVSGGPSAALPMVMPTLGLGEYRPTFVKFSKPPAGRATEELAAWLKLAGDERDRWVPIYPDAGLAAKGAQTIRAFNAWRDYFGDIISAWENIISAGQGAGGWPSGKADLLDWDLWDGGERVKNGGAA